MNNTCRVFWDDEKSSLAVTFVDEGNCDVDTAYYGDKQAIENLGGDLANWIANNGIMTWPNWQKAVHGTYPDGRSLDDGASDGNSIFDPPIS